MINLERTTGSRRLGWVSLIGALLVPIMVAAGFLAATWNSTSRWDKVQAAIVNTDQPVKVDGQTVPLGRQLASGLVKGGTSDQKADQKDDQNFTWVISDADDAADGLADGRYAAVVTIPKDFSKDATSYAANKGSQAQQATLDVQTSKVSGVTDSAIASAISSAAVSSLNGELTKQYLDNLYLGFNQTQQGIQKSADGAKSLSTGVSQLDDGIGKSADGAKSLSTGMQQLSSGTGRLSDGLSQTDTGVTQLATGVSGLADGIQQTDTGVGKLDTGAGKLAEGMDDYTKGVKTYAKGVKKYTSGVTKLTDGLGSYADGVNEYAQGSAKFAGSIKPAIATAREGVSSDTATTQACVAAGFTPGSANCQIFAAGMKAGAAGVADGLQQGLVGTKAKPGPAMQIEAGAKPLESGSTRLSDSAGKLGDAGEQVNTGAKGLASGAKSLDKGIDGLHTGIGKLATGTGKLSKGADQLSTGATKLATGFGKLDDAGNQLATGTAQSATGAGQLSDGLSKLHDGSGKLATGSSQLATGLKKAADQIPTYSKNDRTQLAKVVSAPVAGNQPDGLFANATTTTLLLALALWVGGLATYLVVRAVSSDVFGSQKSSARLALEGVAPGVIIGAAQAVILSALMSVLLDLSAGRAVGLLGFSVFTAVTFAVLNQALVAWFGGVGRFISTAVVVMAVAGSLTNALPDAFAGALSYLPITPALDGVRAIVTGNSSPGHEFGVLLVWMVIGGLASVLAVARRRVATAVPVSAE
ncbi:hypothetical protein GCM10011575_25440 [Microlunatus endophyticus]|uniref:ABC-2 type transporter transmembrane domain-containing protein n=1 Tax=Microlunatus endophyticus TaxID=1716077 RepID=A0A917SAN4_9ACTN|nr:YhgE/Pip domain-containing protein [Microlunatus endophyticus]GGL65930.1 hypothetical protein GCM10011575_25440 [Microlunatus endophyticus]